MDKQPTTKKIHFEHQDPHGTRRDLYQWMRLTDEDKAKGNTCEKASAVLDQLEAENAYTKQILAPTERLQADIYDEIVGRIAPDDSSVPVKKKGYYYQSRYLDGQEYPLYQRSIEYGGSYTTYLDVNALATEHSYLQVGAVAISPDDQLLAYATDTIGRRNYKIYLRNMRDISAEPIQLEVGDTTGSIVWGDSTTLFYIKKDQALRAHQVWRYDLQSKASTLIYEEQDQLYRVFVGKTKDEQFLVLGSASSLTTEYRYVSTAHCCGEWRLFAPRAYREEYHITHHRDHWYIRTNADGADNFKIMRCPSTETGRQHWEAYLPYDRSTYITGMDVTHDHLVLSVRQRGQTELYVKKWPEAKGKIIKMPEESYTIYPGANYEVQQEKYRVRYTSMTTPISTIEIDLNTEGRTILKVQEVLGSFDKDNYVSKRLMAKSHDGIEVPISLVHRKDIDNLAQQPVLLYAYGSYGYSIDPYFSSARLSLLDRGVSFAIAHIRGGSDFGHHWYESGKFLHKKNTFHDFIACGRHLVDHGYCASDQLFGMGGSAGGLLIGAVMNMEPSIWKGMIAAVPFVDVLSTMLDDSIPLTIGEYEEWGNPNEKVYYEYIKSYSPYDNVQAMNYPALLVTTGYHDSQVQYWEPAKWVAKLRELKSDDHLLLFHTNMEAGHSGASGRYRIHKETAMEYAFILYLAGLVSDPE